MFKTIDQTIACNFAKQVIDAKFLIIHYTALSLKQTLKVFNNPQKKASAHFVIDNDGAVYECVKSLGLDRKTQKMPYQAWHAGQSSYLNEKNLNCHSIAVELVSANGNLFEFSDEQYFSLSELTKELIKAYHKFNPPKAIVGHEMVAGSRGKVDPGVNFNWFRYFKSVFSDWDESQLFKICKQRNKIDPQLVHALKEIGIAKAQNTQSNSLPIFWSYLSTWIELSEMMRRAKK